MKENLVLILENNENWAKRTAANLPKKIKDTTSFLFIIEDRIGTKKSLITKNFKKSLDYEIITSTDIIKLWNEKHKSSEFMSEDTLSSNILGLWYVKNFCKSVKKVLMLDDDVILKDNFEDVFDYDYCLFYKSAFPNEMPKDYTTASKNLTTYWNEFFKTLEWKYDSTEWQHVFKNYVCTGTRMIVLDKIDFDYYNRCLENFYNSEVFRTVWNNRDKHRGRAWFMTEIFENVVWRHILNNELGKKKLCYTYFAKADKTSEKALKLSSNRPILHIACGKGKSALYDKMLNLELIK